MSDLVKRLRGLATAFGMHAPDEQIKYLAAFLETDTETLERWVGEAADEIERQYARHAATEKDACKWAQRAETAEAHKAEVEISLANALDRAEAAEARVKVLENDSSAYKQGYNDGYAFYNRACAMKGACGEVASIEALAQEKDNG